MKGVGTMWPGGRPALVQVLSLLLISWVAMSELHYFSGP